MGDLKQFELPNKQHNPGPSERLTIASPQPNEFRESGQAQYERYLADYNRMLHQAALPGVLIGDKREKQITASENGETVTANYDQDGRMTGMTAVDALGRKHSFSLDHGKVTKREEEAAPSWLRAMGCNFDITDITVKDHNKVQSYQIEGGFTTINPPRIIDRSHR